MIDYRKDAENWGNALNDASWELLNSYRSVMGEVESVAFFNNCKTILRAAILEYLDKVEKNEKL